MKQHVRKPFGGPITIFDIDEASKLWSPVQVKPHNLVVNQSADILAQLISGHPEYAISHAYFEYTNTAAAKPTPTVGGGADYFDGLDGVNYDYVRVALDISAALTASSVDFTNNVAKFFAATAGALGEKGSTFSQAATSSVLGVALVSSPSGLIADDLVFSRFYFDTALAKLNGKQIGVSWPVTFTV